MAHAPMRRQAAPPPPPSNRQLALRNARLEKARQAALKLDIFQGEVTSRALSWMIAARMVGEAYKIADNNYKEALQKKAAAGALEVQIFFSVLTVATSGALGWVAYAAAKTAGGLETALRDAVESSIQATAGEVFSANGPLLFPPSGSDLVSQDPQVFQDELENKVDNLHMEVLQAFGTMRRWYLNSPLEVWDIYEESWEEPAHREWIAKAANFAGKDDLPRVDWMARELERGRWKNYVLDNHSYRDFGVFQTADTPDDVGHAVRSRLEKLGVAQASFRKGINLGRDLNKEVDRTTAQVWDWAKHYTVRKFTDEKKNPKGGGPDHQ